MMPLQSFTNYVNSYNKLAHTNARNNNYPRQRRHLTTTKAHFQKPSLKSIRLPPISRKSIKEEEKLTSLSTKRVKFDVPQSTQADDGDVRTSTAENTVGNFIDRNFNKVPSVPKLNPFGRKGIKRLEGSKS